MKLRIRKKLNKRNNIWHFSAWRKFNQYLLFEHNDDGTLDVVHVTLRKNRKIGSAVKYINCVPSAISMGGNNNGSN